MGIQYPESVQTSYQRVLSDGQAGTIADLNPGIDASFISEEANGIPFGRVISQGVQPQGARLGAATIAATAGFTIGTGAVDVVLSNWTPITAGSMELTVNGTALKLASMNFSAVTSLGAASNSVASIIQAALRTAAQTASVTGYASITVVYSATTGQFTITSGTTGASSSVTFVGPSGAGTDVSQKLGFSSEAAYPGSAQVAASALGICVRSVTEQAQIGSSSNGTSIYQGHVGAVRIDGRIKVQVMEATAYNGSVFFSPTTGQIYAGTDSAGYLALGTAKFKGAYNALDIGIIDVTGLR